MPGAATKVQLAPPADWNEHLLLAAVRAYAPAGQPVRPGDAVGELVVLAVEPAPGAALTDQTEVVVGTRPPRGDGATVDVIALLDVSESMGIPWDAKHTRLQAARASLEAFLEGPGPAVASVAIVEYAKEPRLVDGPAPASVVRLGDAPTPKGPSHTARALDFALAQLAARRDVERAQVVFLLTDGVGEPDELQAAVARAARLKVPVHAVVFAPEVDAFFGEIARGTNGSHQRAGYPLTIEFEHHGA